MHVLGVGVALALAAPADLHHELSGHRELQDHVVAVAWRRSAWASRASADPDEVVRVHEDAVLAPGPRRSPRPAPPQLASSLPAGVELEHRRRGVRALRLGNRLRACSTQMRSSSSTADRRHFAEHPVVRDRRPGGIHLEHGHRERRLPAARGASHAASATADANGGRHEVADSDGRNHDGPAGGAEPCPTYVSSPCPGLRSTRCACPTGR